MNDAPRFVRWVGLLVVAASCALAAAPSWSQVRDEKLPTTNGAVNAIARSGNTIYIGGSFTRVFCSNHGAAPLGVVSGELLSCLKVDGLVRVVIPDDLGGWYLGGDFTRVNGVARSNAAHLTRDYVVTAWDPAPQAAVYDLAVQGSVVYLCGDFTVIGATSRNYLAAVDASTGAVLGWNPQADRGALPPRGRTISPASTSPTSPTARERSSSEARSICPRTRARVARSRSTR